AGTVALAAADPRIPVRELAIALGEALAEHLAVAVLTGAEVQAPRGLESPATIYGPLLDRAEDAHQLVLLCADAVGRDDPWARFSIQQADRILLVTGGGPVPAQLTDRHDLSGCDLVLYDAPDEAIEGWAEVLEPIESHVWRSDSLSQDLARTARRLAGRSVGIVLAGGGARGFAHIGVLEELVAAGVQIDRVGGVSMGAVIGALFAMGMDADTMDAVCFDEWVQRRPLSDFTVPRHSLIRGERFSSMLTRTFGERRIESLPLSYFAGSTELRSSSFVVMRSGLLREAVGLSICLPIIAPAQVRGREIFIDGSLTDNLPVATMAELGEGPIIAVDLKASFTSSSGEARRQARARAAARDGADGTGGTDGTDGTDGALTLERAPAAANGGHRAMRKPSLGEVVTRVLLLGSENTSESARRHAALLIRPEISGIGLLEFHQIDAAREAGRAAAREALERLPDAIGV
ncbi:MAG: patatin-like phospholipase family protein, partial [Acidobacteriota bacterium]|nr:patatin-like phospholipase family protein [Acidobacteriota bacterium]